MSKIRVIVKKVGEEPQITEIENSYEAISSIVEGYVEHIYLSNEVGCWLNEEGKLKQLPLNMKLQDCKGKNFDLLNGNLVLIQEEEDKISISMTDENVDKYLKQFGEGALKCEHVDLGFSFF